MQVVVLAAGFSSRMLTSESKLVKKVHGKGILERVVDTAFSLSVDRSPLVVYREGRLKSLQSSLGDDVSNKIEWIMQTPGKEKGTGVAVSSVLHALKSDYTLILLGDVPCLDPEEVGRFVEQVRLRKTMGFISFNNYNPNGYGRVIRENDKVISIVEQVDLTPDQASIPEVNTGIFCVPTEFLKTYVSYLKPSRHSGEYTLTDLVTLWNKNEKSRDVYVHVVPQDRSWRYRGVNDQAQRYELETFYQMTINLNWQQRGVCFQSLNTTIISEDSKIGKDVVLGMNVSIEGSCMISDGVIIEKGSVIKDSVLHSGVHVKAYSVIESSNIGPRSIIGPFAYVQAGCDFDEGVHVGAFVEAKKTVMGKRTKAKHLSYLGRCNFGDDVNVGGGFIHANYDGVNKFYSTIEKGAFLGADSQIVGPCHIGQDAYIACGSCITDDVDDNKLVIARSYQVVKEKKKRKEISSLEEHT